MSCAKSRIDSFATVGEFLKVVECEKSFQESSDDWCGGSWTKAVQYCREGDLSKVAEAEEIVDKLDSEIDSDGVRPMWAPSVVGPLPLVPAYLAGTPESMLAKTDVPDSRGDLEIWANTTVSSNCSSRDMMRRGVVTLAFAMALSRVRNVRLVIYSTVEGASVAIRLSTPIDYSEVCAMFCQPSVTRKLIYCHGKANRRRTGSLYWADWCQLYAGVEGERKALIEKGGMPEDAIMLGTEKLGSYAEYTNEQLVKVLNEKVREYCGAAS